MSLYGVGGRLELAVGVATGAYRVRDSCRAPFGELEKFLKNGFGSGPYPATFELYTGQQDQETRDRILKNPPDILLTNYVMLELMLTRPFEKKIIESARNLEFLVLDELHTYRGRQGADVTLLLRRVRELLGGKQLICVGTSATIASSGTWQQQRTRVAELATRLFGGQVTDSCIVGETLKRGSQPLSESNPSDISALKKAIQQGDKRSLNTFDEFIADPVSRWLEGAVGIIPEEESGRLIRSMPASLTGAAGIGGKLSRLTGLPVPDCERVIISSFLKGATSIRHPETNFPVFAFRIHQFISRGNTVYGTIEPSPQQHLTLEGQQFSPESREKVLLPLCFCRECGQEYYSVWEVREKEGAARFIAREAHNRNTLPGHVPGFLYISEKKPWPQETQSDEILAWLPAD